MKQLSKRGRTGGFMTGTAIGGTLIGLSVWDAGVRSIGRRANFGQESRNAARMIGLVVSMARQAVGMQRIALAPVQQ